MSEEVVSDVFMKLWLMEARLASVRDLRLFLMASVKNATLTVISSNKHHASVEMSDAYDFQLSDNTANPEEQCIFSEAVKQVNLIVASLPTKCQMVFRLIKEERMTYKEVSNIMNISQNTIETHMRIALKKIRNEISNV